MNLSELSEKLSILTSGEWPGNPPARQRMAPDTRGIPKDGQVLRKAAVMILLFPDDEGISLVLIRRTKDNGPHSNQISLPGGMAESEDINPEETAIRETMEEIGVIGKDIKISGKLSELLIPVSNTAVSPVIGYLDYKPSFNPDPSEVEYLILIPLKEILDPGIIATDDKMVAGKSVQVPCFHINGEKIWGATAMILSEFIDLVQKAGQ